MKAIHPTALPFLLAGLISFLLQPPSEAELVGHWAFDAGDGTVIHDSSGSGNHGTLINPKAGTWTVGVHGSALYLDGTTGNASTHVEIPDSPSLRIADAITFTAWVRCDDIFRDAPILAKENYGSGGSYWFGAFGATGEGASPGNFGVLLASSGYWDTFDRNQGSIPEGNWVHIASTWDGVTVRHYLNGAPLPATNTFTGPIKPSTAFLAIGVNSVPNTTAFKGSIDDLRLYDNALSSGEILALSEPSLPFRITTVNVEG